MKVHIVCVDDGHIVPRMYGWLRDAHGWTMSNQTDPAADINYFATYTFYRPVATKTAAWFTHYETSSPGKMALWSRASRAIDMAIVTAPASYSILNQDLAAGGATTYVTPGYDENHFKIMTSVQRKGKSVAVSGIGQPRKGPEIAATLRQFDHIDLRIFGKGWGIEGERWVEYPDLPTAYNEIDVYLVTATAEGIPATVLEMAACGAKVVMPATVGIGPSVEGLPGFFFYEAGNVAEAVVAVNRALKQRVSRKKISAAIEGRYNQQMWLDSNLHALQRLHDGER